MKLTDNIAQIFKVARVFHDNTDKINSIDFTPDGETLITSSDDESMNLYNCPKGMHIRTLLSKKYGVDLIRFTHAHNTVLHSSTKVDDSLRYLSLHDNKYLRYFSGHTKKVTSLCLSPIEDLFMSGSLDKTVRIWDLKTPNCLGILTLPGTRPVVNFDPEGLIFAVGYNSNTVKLYDLKSYEKGPFNTFILPQDKDCDWTGLKFSPDGKTILISTNGNVIHLIDAFQGNPLQTFTGHQNRGLPLEASFSPDSQYVFSGSSDGKVHVWHAETGRKAADLYSTRTAPVQCIQFNPKYVFIASACTSVSFWIPIFEEAS